VLQAATPPFFGQHLLRKVKTLIKYFKIFMSLLTAAKGLVKKGFSVVATDANKLAVVLWKKYQEAAPTEADLQAQFSRQNAKGIAVICGKVSGSLEVVDVDVKYDNTGTLFNDLMAAIHDVSEELSNKLMVVQTRSGGYHLYYRCQTIQGNQKLAQRPPTQDELKESPNEKVLVLVETRGEGGYVIAPPTEGYKKISGTVTEITVEEREVLLEICRSFNQYVVEQSKPMSVRSDNYALSPWEDYNRRGIEDMVKTLERHGWTIVNQRHDKVIFKRPGKTDSKTSGDYSHEHNLFTVFTTSSIFEPLKGYRPAAVFTMLECNGDFREGARKLAAMGYGEKSQSFGEKLEKELFQKKLDGYSTDDLQKLLIDKHQKKQEEAIEIVSTLELQWGERLCIFWDVDAKTRRLQIHRTRWVDFLHEVGGFGLYFYDTNSTIYRIIRSKDGFVEESSTEQMKKFILDYIDGLPDTFDGGITPGDLKEIVLKQYNNLFNDGFLEFLPSVHLDFLKDTADKSYYAFRNGVVVITKDGVKLDGYKNLNKVIWKNQVIDFSFSTDQSFAPDSCEYYRFIEKISGEEEERIIYCLTLIGYNLHKYKDPSKPYATVNAEETDNEKDGGGTGKGIFNKALSYLLRTIKLDGKTFDVGKNFSMQRVSLDTQLICVEDCDKRFDFEKFNSHLTEGSTVEKKNRDELYIDYKDSPKFIFNTNYSLNIQGNHGKRRSKVFEFAPFFGPNNTPLDFFGHLLFEDWDKDEWNRFYNLMFFCLSVYLQGGIKEVVGSEKMRRKQIKLGFGEEFLEWWDEYSGNGAYDWKPFKELYHNFILENEYEKKDYSQKRFKKALESSAELTKIECETRRNRQAENRHEFRLVKKGEKKPD
jgi:hypothetical protein